jgi:hypothetical protein
MKKSMIVGFLLTLASGVTLEAKTLKFPEPETIDLGTVSPHAKTVGLYLTKEFMEFKHTKKTSPFDRLHYPVGAYSAKLFKVNLPQVFQTVVDSDTQTPGEGVDLVVEPSIVSFNAVVPRPAWKPYLATIVYRVDVYDKSGEKIFTQTATAEGQTSKGMMSGFSAGKQCTTATMMATQKAAKDLLEGLLDSEEIKGAGVASAASEPAR